ncbi:cytochrome P450 94A2-like [Gastrolobium bilobum]|uniref:cytochrome P450 94A2-like n=1 Tax=Gastrolobium bilobum TaxID=150636 RepID=UPI002AB19455|nr:cytochrome P450 94A2-like [Gastrolobium bilobum]
MEFETWIIASLVLLLPTMVWFLVTTLSKSNTSSSTTAIPKAYPIIGSVFSIAANKHRRVQWISDILNKTPSSTFVLHRAFGSRQVFTANPAVVQHILKNSFPLYNKGYTLSRALGDFLGNGIFNANGENWKFQRQISSHEFNTRSLRKFVETVVDVELSDRLFPILSKAQKTTLVIDFQDILQRFTFDNICKIAFGFDPEYLIPSLPEKTAFAKAFDDGTSLSSERFNSAIPLFWKMKKLLNVGSEKQLKNAISEVRGLARKITREKKQELKEKATLETVDDLLSRFLSSGHLDEEFLIDIVISFILAGRDTTSAALTWFFWLLYKHPHVEHEVLKEVNEKSEAPVYDEVKDMVYTHAALCESMRLYPPVPVDTKEAVNDDVLPDGTFVKKGTRVAYHIYAMGRSDKIWGSDWAQFRPERWLNRVEGKWSFVGVSPFAYPVFQAGPRVCLGKDMAFLQMKRVVAGVMRRFRVVPAVEEGVEPVYTAHLTSLMKGGFPVRIENLS